jgi:hypothetical protein
VVGNGHEWDIIIISLTILKKIFKIEGLDQRTQNFEQARQAIAGIDGELGTVKSNPHASCKY